MDSLKLCFILLMAMIVLGCSDRSNDMRITPVSENACNVSCGYDHESYKACLEIPVVTDYTMRQLLPALFPVVTPIVKEQPPGACFCSLAVLDDSGKFVSVTITDTSDERMGNELREAILDNEAIPIPSGAECVVGMGMPLSFNN